MMKPLFIAMGLLATACATQNGDKTYREAEEKYVSKAIYIYSGKGRISRSEIEKDVRPVVVYLPDMICVGLNLRPGHAGGDTTICFDKNGNEVLHHVSGD